MENNKVTYSKNNKKRTTNEYINELKIKNPNVTVLEEYINSNTPILHLHKNCGHTTKSTPTRMLKGCGCVLCKGKKISKTKAKSHEQFLNELYLNNPKVTIVDGIYINNNTKLKCRCNICGNIWDAKPQHLLEGHGCKKCADKALGDSKRKSHEQFVKELKKINPYIEILGKYISTHTKIQCKCNICSHIWDASPAHLLNNKGCPVCNEPKGERNIKKFLEEENIQYFRGYKFSDLRGVGKGYLSYDFYLPEYNLLIEFQGKQHDKPIDYFGGEEKFKIQQEHDKRKCEYANKNNINFLKIMYEDIDNIHNILKQYINNLKLKTVETTGVA